ncbi:MAG: Nramp family divalent metal transporter [Candidatus Eisenbacteria bacterium]
MKLDPDTPSLAEVHRSVAIPQTGNWLRRMFAFAGPAYLVSVGYMDPGNWATDLAGGAKFGYQLVWVLVMSNLIAVLLQTLSARLGVVTGKDLAQACRDYYPPFLTMPLWILCEIAIIACDLAEVLGAAIGLQLLFGVPLLWGVLITGFDVLLLLAFGRLGMRRLEALIITLVVTIGGCFAVEMFMSRPDVLAILAHVIPRDFSGVPSLFGRDPSGEQTVLGLNSSSLYIAMGILGATVMPHNLYLHSALVQSRAVAASVEAKRQACRLNLVDSVVALNAALFVNGAILVLAGTVFHTTGNQGVSSLHEAHRLLAPLLGTALASTLFAVALLCSGQASTITGTLAGQIVMEGFLRIRIQPWLRRLISRSLAIVPAALVIVWQGERGVDSLLVLSQVVLSLQLSFAVVPLITFTSDRSKMGTFANKAWVIALAVIAATAIIGLNAKLVVDTLGTWLAAAPPDAWWLRVVVVPLVVAVALLLVLILIMPLLVRFAPRFARGAMAGAPATAGGGAAPGFALEPAAATPAPERLIPSADARWKRVAVALDLGPADAAVLDHVRGLPLPPGGEVFLLHVAESAASRFLGAESSDLEQREDQVTLERHAEALRAAGIPARVELGFGDPRSELARMTNELGADLLITGSHGHGFIRDIVYGATVSALRHRVRCTVLTVRPTSDQNWTSFRKRPKPPGA